MFKYSAYRQGGPFVFCTMMLFGMYPYGLKQISFFLFSFPFFPLSLSVSHNLPQESHTGFCLRAPLYGTFDTSKLVLYLNTHKRELCERTF